MYLKQMNLCSVQVYPCISNKQIFSVRITELDYAFYNKTVGDISNIKTQTTLKNYFPLVSIVAFN